MRLLLSYLTALGFLLVAASADGGEAPVVSTEEGKVSGVVEKAAHGNLFNSYYGIPYAKPPVGDLRFQDPVEAAKWTGVRDGSMMPSTCVEIPFGIVMMGITLAPEEIPGKEDCLYLNVFTPEGAPPKGNYPVMVFIHGGGFFAGGAEEYLPHVLMSKDIILVVIQYRLGFLGFLSTDDSVMPGNYGLKDQTLALQWVQRNIGNFGGNPDKVTIFGESAGGASVHYQMLTPKAKGLFSGAIMQSGNAFCPWALTSEHRQAAKKVGLIAGCNLDEGSRTFLKCMQSADASKINAALQDVFVWFLTPMLAVPRVDGDYLPDHPAKLMLQGRYTKVNLMAGMVANEGAIVSQGLYGDRSNLVDELKNNFPINGPHSIALSPDDANAKALTSSLYNYYLGGVANVDSRHSEEFTQMMSDIFFAIGHDHVTQIHARDEGTNTYRYELSHRGQMSFGDFTTKDIGRHWVTHADDLLYLFRGGPMITPSIQPPERPKDLKTTDDLYVRRLMVTLWTNFAATGNPTPDKSLGFKWAAITPDDLRHLELSTTPSMREDTRKERRKFVTSLPTDTNLILNPNLTSDNQSSSSSAKRHQDEL